MLQLLHLHKCLNLEIKDFSLDYGLSPWSDWFTSIDGKIHHDFTSDINSPKMKAYLEEMRKWYAEKLIDQSILIDHFDKAEAQILSNQVGAEQRWTGTFMARNKQMQAEDPSVYWKLAMPPVGPFGDRAYENYPYINGERWILTSANKNPEITAKLFDYVFASEEGQLMK